MSAHSQLVCEVLQALRLAGWWAKKTHDERRRPAEEGMPDIIAVRHRAGKTRFMGIEVKIGYDKPNDGQMQMCREITEAGGTAIVLKQFSDIEPWL